MTHCRCAGKGDAILDRRINRIGERKIFCICARATKINVRGRQKRVSARFLPFLLVVIRTFNRWSFKTMRDDAARPLIRRSSRSRDRPSAIAKQKRPLNGDTGSQKRPERESLESARSTRRGEVTHAAPHLKGLPV